VIVAWISVLAIAGWAMGAAVWVAAVALARGEVFLARPACRACGAALPVTAWLPVYGFGTALICPTCERRQDLRRPVVEIGMALYFVAAGLLIDDATRLLTALAFAIPLLAIALVDLWSRQVYPNLLGLAALMGIILAGLDGFDGISASIKGLLAGAALLALYRFVARVIYPSLGLAPLGWIDVMLGAMIGAMVRWPVVLGALFVGLLAAAIVDIALLLVHRDRRRRAALYGPFLCLGALAAILLQF
jgi:leader peptidase (prepilin peptidase)/N-methyltransferase